jgi:Zn-dependent metalloprotease
MNWFNGGWQANKPLSSRFKLVQTTTMKVPKQQHSTQQITQEVVVEGMVVEEAMAMGGEALTTVGEDMATTAEVVEVKAEVEAEAAILVVDEAEADLSLLLVLVTATTAANLTTKKPNVVRRSGTWHRKMQATVMEVALHQLQE